MTKYFAGLHFNIKEGTVFDDGKAGRNVGPHVGPANAITGVIIIPAVSA